MKNIKVALFLPVLALAFFIGVPYASAAVGTISCTLEAEAPAHFLGCTGSGWTPSSSILALTLQGSDACAPGGVLTNCDTDSGGNITDCPVAPTYTLPGGTYYFYGTEDACSTSIADTNNPHVVTTPPPPFTEAIGTGLLSIVGDLGDSFGPIALLVIGFALGLYGIKVGFSYLIRYVSVGKEGRKRRRRRS